MSLMYSDRFPATQYPTNHIFCVAPMMDYTDRHCRYLLRLLSRKAFLYTEMIPARSLTQDNSPARLLDFNQPEHPIALQLGGSDPQVLANATRIAAIWGYDEVNLNIGCPSARVSSGRIGACLLAEPYLVADCVRAMCDASSLPITIKTRIGLDNLDADHYLDFFINTVAAAGCRTFIIHARKAWLKGLSPKENREIPPLNYERVYRLKKMFPDLQIILNGGLQSLKSAKRVLDHSHNPSVDGVMIGRALYKDPYMLTKVDKHFFNERSHVKSRSEVVNQYVAYADKAVRLGCRPHYILRHLSGLFHGCEGAGAWRKLLNRIGQTGEPTRDLVKLAIELDGYISVAA